MWYEMLHSLMLALPNGGDFRLLTQAKRAEMAEQADFADLINSRNTPIGYLAEECHNGTPYEELY
jgi:hypothetical protein